MQQQTPRPPSLHYLLSVLVVALLLSSNAVVQVSAQSQGSIIVTMPPDPTPSPTDKPTHLPTTATTTTSKAPLQVSAQSQGSISVTVQPDPTPAPTHKPTHVSTTTTTSGKTPNPTTSSVVRDSSSASSSRQIKHFNLPVFGMQFHITVDENTNTDDENDDDDAELYLDDIEMFQETLERVTQIHLTDIFQQYDGKIFSDDERLIKVALVTKVRQEGFCAQVSNGATTKHLPLSAAYSGMVTFSFPTDHVPSSTEDVASSISNILEQSLVGDNYLLLLRRYLNTGILAAIEEIPTITIETTVVVDLEYSSSISTINTGTANDSGGVSPDIDSTKSNNIASTTTKTQHHQQLNVIAIVAIVAFLTLSCLLMLFGATIMLIMKDRAQQEETLQDQTMTSLGMVASKNDEEALQGEARTNRHGDSKDMPKWKRMVLPVLRRAITVRRYWKNQLKKRNRTKGTDATTNTTNNTVDSLEDGPVAVIVAHNGDSINLEDDDGLNDEDIYYDDKLTDEEAAALWLDRWTQSLTSIPIRKVSPSTTARQEAATAATASRTAPSKQHHRRKSSKKSRPLQPHPAKRQSQQNFLGCIAEDEENDDEDEDDFDGSTSGSSSGDGHEESQLNIDSKNISKEMTSKISSRSLEKDVPTESYDGFELDAEDDDRIEDVDLS